MTSNEKQNTLALNQRAQGSNPCRPTFKIKPFRNEGLLFFKYYSITLECFFVEFISPSLKPDCCLIQKLLLLIYLYVDFIIFHHPNVPQTQR